MASRPSLAGSPIADPATAPMTVPTNQPRYCGKVAPRSSLRSNRPPRLASAHDASTTAWPSAARRSGAPSSAGAKAIPIGRKRALTRAAARTAANTVPPSPSTDVAANCADPE